MNLYSVPNFFLEQLFNLMKLLRWINVFPYVINSSKNFTELMIEMSENPYFVIKEMWNARKFRRQKKYLKI